MHKRILRFRRSVTVLGGLLVATVWVIGGAPTAFARLDDPSDRPETFAAPVVAAHGGMLGWQIALIAIGAAVAASIATALALRSGRSRRIGLQSAG